MYRSILYMYVHAYDTLWQKFHKFCTLMFSFYYLLFRDEDLCTKQQKTDPSQIKKKSKRHTFFEQHNKKTT